MRFRWEPPPEQAASHFEEYYFKDYPPKKKGGVWVCEVARFDCRRRPIVVYLVEKGWRGWRCDCPGSRGMGPCKHVRMVQDWVAAGMPSPFQKWEGR